MLAATAAVRRGPSSRFIGPIAAMDQPASSAHTRESPLPNHLRLQLGSDCVGLVENKLTSVAKELDRWRELAVSTDD